MTPDMDQPIYKHAATLALMWELVQHITRGRTVVEIDTEDGWMSESPNGDEQWMFDVSMRAARLADYIDQSEPALAVVLRKSASLKNGDGSH